MGTPTPPPPIVGDHCALCDDVHWPAGDTPRFITLQVSGLERCPVADYDAPNGVYILEQVPASPCVWQYDKDKHFWEVEVAADGYVFGMQKRDAGGYRHAFLGDLFGCVDNTDNNYIDCSDGVACFSGSVTIIW